MLTAKADHFLLPDWPAPANVRAIVTTRHSGNLAMHVNDDAIMVEANRRRLSQELMFPQDPLWIQQVHGIEAVNRDSPPDSPVGDALYSETPGNVCAILTADCLPLLVTARDGRKIAAIHAGWRGLLAGIIDSVLQVLQIPSDDILVWLGPAIGPDHFIVGAEVREKFINRHPDYAAGFYPAEKDHWFADIYRLAKINLYHRGVQHVYGGGLCTFCDRERFYSYRRGQATTGRMASLIWLI